MKCNKIKYDTANQAWKALKRINKEHNDNKLKNVYICDNCNWYHVTSMNDYQVKRFEKYILRL